MFTVNIKINLDNPFTLESRNQLLLMNEKEVSEKLFFIVFSTVSLGPLLWIELCR